MFMRDFLGSSWIDCLWKLRRWRSGRGGQRALAFATAATHRHDTGQTGQEQPQRRRNRNFSATALGVREAHDPVARGGLNQRDRERQQLLRSEGASVDGQVVQKE